MPPKWPSIVLVVPKASPRPHYTRPFILKKFVELEETVYKSQWALVVVPIYSFYNWYIDPRSSPFCKVFSEKDFYPWIIALQRSRKISTHLVPTIVPMVRFLTLQQEIVHLGLAVVVMLQRRLKFSFDVLSLAVELLCQLGVTTANTFSALTLKLILGSMEIGAFGSVRFATNLQILTASR